MDSDEKEIDPMDRSRAHPRAQELLLEEWFWDSTDTLSPLGNDTGFDLMNLYIEWREEHPRAGAERFFKEQLADWEVENSGWDAIQEERVGHLIEVDSYSFKMRDEMAIAFAFTQLILHGAIVEPALSRALTAIERQLLPVGHLGWLEHEVRGERVGRLLVMREKLLLCTR